MNTLSRSGTLGLALAISCATAILLLVTSPSIPIVWDEGDTIMRSEYVSRLAEPQGPDDHRAWWDLVRDPGNWPYTTVREGHPPLAGMVIAAGRWLASGWLEPLTAERFGPIVLFSIAVGAIFYRLQREYQVLAVSLMAVAAVLTMPRLFAHAHFATLDGTLTACWVLAWASFAPARSNWAGKLAFGLALGLTLSAKFTGWLAPVPFVAWAILYRDRSAGRALAVGIPLALAIFVALNPPLWEDPLGGLRTFFELNLDRAARPRHNISTQFFGRMYNLDYPLPWCNALVWTAITISPMMLVLGCVGLVATCKRWRSDRVATLVALEWVTLIVVRTLPLAPPHDAERLILPSFAFFAALVGIGCGRALYRNTLLDRDKIVAQGWAKVAMAIALVAATFDSISYFPHGLSYYNRLIGGLSGAAALGMEPTYYWDSLDQTALDWINGHLKAEEKPAFGSAPRKNLELLHRWGRLHRLPTDPGVYRWYVIQRRPSAWSDVDRWLINHEQPVEQRTFSGVALLDIYDYEQYARGLAATQQPEK